LEFEVPKVKEAFHFKHPIGYWRIKYLVFSKLIAEGVPQL